MSTSVDNNLIFDDQEDFLAHVSERNLVVEHMTHYYDLEPVCTKGFFSFLFSVRFLDISEGEKHSMRTSSLLHTLKHQKEVCKKDNFRRVAVNMLPRDNHDDEMIDEGHFFKVT